MHSKSPQHHHRSTGHSLRSRPSRTHQCRESTRMTVAFARRRQRTLGSGPETGTNCWFGTARSHHGDSESPRRRGCEARGNPKVWGTLSLGTWLLAIEPTVRSSARSSKGRLSECQRSLTRMTSTVKVEGLIREIVNRDEDAGGDTEPKSSNRAKNCWFMAGAGHREEGSRAESDKVPTSRFSTVAAPERVRLSECQRSLTRMTSTVKVEGLIREIVNRDEDAGGDTEPKSSNRAKNCWFMAGAGHREEQGRLRRCRADREGSTSCDKVADHLGVVSPMLTMPGDFDRPR